MQQKSHYISVNAVVNGKVSIICLGFSWTGKKSFWITELNYIFLLLHFYSYL